MDMEKKDSLRGHSPVPAVRSAPAIATTWIACVAGAFTWTEQWRIELRPCRSKKVIFFRSGNPLISELDWVPTNFKIWIRQLWCDLKKISQWTRYAAYNQCNHNGVRLPTQQRITYKTSSVLHSTPIYNIWRKSSLSFLCSPYHTQSNNPKSRSTFALKSQIAQCK